MDTLKSDTSTVSEAPKTTHHEQKKEDKQPVRNFFHELGVHKPDGTLINRLANKLGGGTSYLISGKAPEEGSTDAFIHLMLPAEPTGIADYPNGRLPQKMPLRAFREYMKHKVPEDTQSETLNLHLADDFAIPSPGSHQFIPLQPYETIGQHIHIKVGAINTLAQRNVAAGNNLPNLVACVPADEHNNDLSFRCGVIDTERKKLAFMASLKHVLEGHRSQVDAKQVRLLLQQLNTPGVKVPIIGDIGEEHLIENQDKQAHEMESLMEKFLGKNASPPMVAHFNTAVDAFSAEFRGQLTKSHKENAYATAVAIDWVMKDFFEGKIPKELESSLGKVQETMNKLIKAWQDEPKAIERRTSRLQDQLKHAAKPLHDHSLKLTMSAEGKKEQQVALQLLAHLVAVQTEKCSETKQRHLRPAQEVGLGLLVGRLARAILELNCYSGADRTGCFTALLWALDKKLAQVENRIEALKAAYDFLMTFEERVEAMDKDLKGLAHDSDFDAWLAGDGKAYADIVAFQRDFVAYALGASLPLIHRSTGIWGLKWRQLIQDNYMIPYLPRRMYDEESKTWFAIVDLKKERLSDDGAAMFVGQSEHRKG